MYMSPEVADCKPYGAASDTYGLGCVLLELLLRHQLRERRPFEERKDYIKEALAAAAGHGWHTFERSSDLVWRMLDESPKSRIELPAAAAVAAAAISIMARLQPVAGTESSSGAGAEPLVSTVSVTSASVHSAAVTERQPERHRTNPPKRVAAVLDGECGALEQRGHTGGGGVIVDSPELAGLLVPAEAGVGLAFGFALERAGHPALLVDVGDDHGFDGDTELLEPGEGSNAVAVAVGAFDGVGADDGEEAGARPFGSLQFEHVERGQPIPRHDPRAQLFGDEKTSARSVAAHQRRNMSGVAARGRGGVNVNGGVNGGVDDGVADEGAGVDAGGDGAKASKGTNHSNHGCG
jgi:hypothetical protein